jgi:hypothetical protein
MDHGGRHPHTAAMGPHPRQQSTQQSTDIICDGSTSLKLEKKNITSNMTIIAHRVDNYVRQWRCNDGTMGTVQPAGRIRRCQWQVDACMCVGIKGRQGGAPGGWDGDKFLRTVIMQLGSGSFFWQHDVGGSTRNNSY